MLGWRGSTVAKVNGSDGGIGARVALIRRRWGMSQQRLAMEAHVSKSLLSKVEAGWRPATPPFTAAVARALGVDVAELTQQPYRSLAASEEQLHRAIPTIRRSLLTSELPDEDERPAAWTRCGRTWSARRGWAGKRGTSS